MKPDISFSEYWIELKDKIEKRTRPSLKDEFLSLLWKEPLLELSIGSFITGLVVIRVLGMLGMIKYIEYLPRIMGLIL